MPDVFHVVFKAAFRAQFGGQHTFQTVRQQLRDLKCEWMCRALTTGSHARPGTVLTVHVWHLAGLLHQILEKPCRHLHENGCSLKSTEGTVGIQVCVCILVFLTRCMRPAAAWKTAAGFST